LKIQPSSKQKSAITPEQRYNEAFGVKDESENIKRQREDYAV